MSTLASLNTSVKSITGILDSSLPGSDARRFASLVARLISELQVDGSSPVWFASAAGRTELAGNHTDHNRGRVLAASINLDSIAAVVPRGDPVVRIASEGFPLVELSLDDLEPRADERETTASLVRGVAAGFVRDGFTIGGFDATVSSDVLTGSGLSSSASIEVLLGAILDVVYNDSKVGSTRIARIGQFAENTFFGKPSGLMDQVACATGGAVTIDFADAAHPVIERIDVSFDEAGLSLLVVDTGANHADLTHEYAALPADMRAIAARLGGEVLRDVAPQTFYANLSRLRGEVGDRAVARAMHFYDENRRVDLMVRSLKEHDIATYLGLMADSGRSSGLFLQNCVPTGHPEQQGVVIALALADHYFAEASLRNGVDCAARVHGGGFAGTIQVLLPHDHVESFGRFVGTYLGDDAVTTLSIRSVGATAFAARDTQEDR